MSNNKRYYETEEFLTLRDEWYRKLELEGFEDIERTEKGKYPSYHSKGVYFPRLKFYSCQWAPYFINGTIEYFALAQDLLLEERPKGRKGDIFRNNTDRDLWRLHTEGYSIKEIIADRKNRGLKKKLTYFQVYRRIERIRKYLLNRLLHG